MSIAIQLASKPQVLVIGIHINCFTITWEVNSVFPGQSIIHSYLTFKVAENPVTFKVDKPGIQADRLLCLVKLLAQSVLGVFNRSLSVKLGIFPISCQHWHPIIMQFIIKLVKMWPGGTPHVVVGTLKISLDRLITAQWKEKQKYSNE